MAVWISLLVKAPFELARRPMAAGDRFWASPLEVAALLATGKAKPDPKPPAEPVVVKPLIVRPPPVQAKAMRKPPQSVTPSRRQIEALAESAAIRTEEERAAAAVKRAPFMAVLEAGGPEAVELAQHIARSHVAGADPVLLEKVRSVILAERAEKAGAA